MDFKRLYLNYKKLQKPIMKKVLLLFIFFISFSKAFSQDNFVALDNKLVWETVFINNEPNIAGILQKHSKFKITEGKDGIYTGKAAKMSSNCDSQSKALNHEYDFDFEIEVSEGKYRVTITNIVFKGKGGAKAEKFFLEKGEVKSTKAVEADLTCLDTYFTKLFSMTTVYKNKS